MNRGDIYTVSLHPMQRHEQRGHRPVLVVSPTAFNKATKLPVVLPFTSGGDFGRRLGSAVPLTGTQTAGMIRCDQPRVLDLHVRGARRIESLLVEALDEVLARAITLFQ